MKDIGDVVCAIIERNGKFLVAQRPPGHLLAGKWEFPGGKVSIGESSIDAVKREIQEELHLDIYVHSPLTPNHHIYSNFSLNLIPFLCTIKSGKPKLTEHQRIAWVTSATIKDYEMSEADIPILNEYLSLRRTG